MNALTRETKFRFQSGQFTQDFTGNLENVGRGIMELFLKNDFSDHPQITLIEPSEIEALTPAEISTLKEQVANQIPGAVFMAIHLGLTNHKELGIREEK